MGVCVGSVPFIGSTARSVRVKNSVYPIRYKGRKEVHLYAVLKNKQNKPPYSVKAHTLKPVYRLLESGFYKLRTFL